MPLTGEEKARWMREYRESRMELRRELAFRHLGDRCRECGEDDRELLEFHHLNPEDKEFNVQGEGWSVSLERFLEEVHKCVVLCVVCHTKVDPQRRALALEVAR